MNKQDPGQERRQELLAHLDRLAVSGSFYAPRPRAWEPLWLQIVAVGALLMLVLGAAAVLYGALL